MDLDHFKRVNDAHGHQVGDRVLEHAAEVLRDETRTGELVARVGGEEFAMLLPRGRRDEAYRAAERIRRAVAAATFPAVGSMTMSAGVCDITQAARRRVTLYRLADGALYLGQAPRPGHGGALLAGGHRDAPRPRGGRAPGAPAGARERPPAGAGRWTPARRAPAATPSGWGTSAAEIAEALGWTPERAALLREAGLVHDVGKIGVSDAILFKPGPLTPEEYELVKEHAELGARIVREALTPEQVVVGTWPPRALGREWVS